MTRDTLGMTRDDKGLLERLGKTMDDLRSLGMTRDDKG